MLTSMRCKYSVEIGFEVTQMGDLSILEYISKLQIWRHFWLEFGPRISVLIVELQRPRGRWETDCNRIDDVVLVVCEWIDKDFRIWSYGDGKRTKRRSAGNTIAWPRRQVRMHPPWPKQHRLEAAGQDVLNQTMPVFQKVPSSQFN